MILEEDDYIAKNSTQQNFSDTVIEVMYSSLRKDMLQPPLCCSSSAAISRVILSSFIQRALYWIQLLWILEFFIFKSNNVYALSSYCLYINVVWFTSDRFAILAIFPAKI